MPTSDPPSTRFVPIKSCRPATTLGTNMSTSPTRRWPLLGPGNAAQTTTIQWTSPGAGSGRKSNGKPQSVISINIILHISISFYSISISLSFYSISVYLYIIHMMKIKWTHWEVLHRILVSEHMWETLEIFDLQGTIHVKCSHGLPAGTSL